MGALTFKTMSRWSQEKFATEDEGFAYADSARVTQSPFTRQGFERRPPAHNTQSYAAVLARHAENVRYVQEVIRQTPRDAKTSKFGVRWRNTMEALESGYVRCGVYTLTHDHEARVKAAQKPGHYGAYFGGDKPNYNWRDTCDSRNLVFRGSVGGSAMGSVISLFEPKNFEPAFIRRLLVHETQHAFFPLRRAEGDFNYNEERPEESPKVGGTHFFQLEHYRTEFAAYWVDEELAKFSARPGTADPTRSVSLENSEQIILGGFANARQQQIFATLLTNRAYAYYLVPAWRDANFRAAVRALACPQLFNYNNSIRVDKLRRALEDDNVMLAQQRIRELDANDRAAIVSPSMRDNWWALCRQLARVEDQEYFLRQLRLPLESKSGYSRLNETAQPIRLTGE